MTNPAVQIFPNKSEVLPFSMVRPHGLFRDRIELSLDRHLRYENTLCTYIGWGADQIARWSETVAVLSALTGRNTASLVRHRLDEMIASQDKDGLFYGERFKETPERVRETWFGHGRALWTLVRYYELTGDEFVLAPLERSIDAVLVHREALKISTPVICGVESGLGAIVHASQILGRPDYLEFAKWMSSQIDFKVAQPSALVQAHIPIEQLQQPYQLVEHGHHSHSHLSITLGLVELANATGDKRYLDTAVEVVEQVLPSLWINGDLPEGYGQLYEYNDEICTVVDWTDLCLAMHGMTGDVKYLDYTELSALNYTLMGQNFDGGFVADWSCDREHWVRDHNQHNWGQVADCCCTMSGGLMLGNLSRHAVARSPGGISVNLLIDVDVDLGHANGAGMLSQRVSCGAGHQLICTITTPATMPADTLRVRIPYWATATRLVIDGHSLSVPKERWLAISCPGGHEHRIQIHYTMNLTVVGERRNILSNQASHIPGDAVTKGLQYGPYVLMLFREMYPDIVDRRIDISIFVDASGQPGMDVINPIAWRRLGLIPIGVRAVVNDRWEVYLVPCANAAAVPPSTHEPYVIRFDSVEIKPRVP